MPKASGGKTVSARKLAFGLVIAAGIIAAAWLVIIQHHGAASRPSYATLPLQLKDRKVTLEVADTPAKQELGLGQRDSLPQGTGMVFPYAQEKQLCFWMKDMRFPIDMVWLDGSKKIVHIESNVSPDTYPKTYCPDQPAQYVVELNANVAQQAGMQSGQQLNF